MIFLKWHERWKQYIEMGKDILDLQKDSDSALIPIFVQVGVMLMT